MKKVDFSAVVMKDISGKEQRIDMRLAIGNTLYMQGGDIKECELGQRIFHQKGADGETPAQPIELTDDEVKIVRRFAEQIPSYVTRRAILDAIEH